jgi:two-component system, chemotaxis family, protein-glutamate methylesterase/glutaminase
MRLPGHDIIVVGASAGGVEALSTLVHGLPADLPAALFVVLHVPAQAPSLLPAILNRVSPLLISQAIDGEKIQHGHIYVAPPDYHLLVERDFVRVIRGPKENRSRPAVDPLFRSAALAYGPRVVGVILTGALDDGTVGMRALKSRGGIGVVQDPNEALYSGMPRSAMENSKIDFILPLSEIASLLVHLANQEAEEEGAYPVPDDLKTEGEIAEQGLDSEQMVASVYNLGVTSAFTCPECHGTLWELRDGELLRYRCHVGHAFTANSLEAEQSEALEDALWSGLRALEEKAVFAKRMAARAHERKNYRAAESFQKKAALASKHAEIVRNILLNGRENSPVEDTVDAA